MNQSLSLEYINSILGSYNEIEVRKALSKIIESEISKQVLANSLENYSFMILDPPVLPLKKFSPRRTIICLTFALSALLIHIIILSISYGFKISLQMSRFYVVFAYFYFQCM